MKKFRVRWKESYAIDIESESWEGVLKAFRQGEFDMIDGEMYNVEFDSIEEIVE